MMMMARLRSRIYQCLWLPVTRLLRKKTVLALILSLSFIYCMLNLYNGKTSSLKYQGSHHDNDYTDFIDPDRRFAALRRTGGGHHPQQQQQSSLENEPHRGLNAVLAAGGGNSIVQGLDLDTEDDNELAVVPEAGDGSDIKRPDSGLASRSKIQSRVQTCRNSIQGRVLISDDKGYVCHRKDVNPSGCCSSSLEGGSDGALSLKRHQRYSCETCNMESGCCAIFEYCISCCLDPEKKPLLSQFNKESTTSSPSLGSSALFASLTDQFDFCLAKCRTSSQSVQHENSYSNPKTKHCFTSEKAIKQMRPQVTTSSSMATNDTVSQANVMSVKNPSSSSSVKKDSHVEKPDEKET